MTLCLLDDLLRGPAAVVQGRLAVLSMLQSSPALRPPKSCSTSQLSFNFLGSCVVDNDKQLRDPSNFLYDLEPRNVGRDAIVLTLNAWRRALP